MAAPRRWPPHPTVSRVLDRAARALLARHRVARLATADADGAPHLVPVCYARAGDRLYFVIDAKPKRPHRTRAETHAEHRGESRPLHCWSTTTPRTGARSSSSWYAATPRSSTTPRERARALAALRVRYPQYRTMDLDGPGAPGGRASRRSTCTHGARRRSAAHSASRRRAIAAARRRLGSSEAAAIASRRFDGADTPAEPAERARGGAPEPGIGITVGEREHEIDRRRAVSDPAVPAPRARRSARRLRHRRGCAASASRTRASPGATSRST